MTHPSNEIIEALNHFDFIAPADFENILEWLDDGDYLSEKGKGFRREYWEFFIKKPSPAGR